MSPTFHCSPERNLIGHKQELGAFAAPPIFPLPLAEGEIQKGVPVPVTCIACHGPLTDAPGIGPYCNNKACERNDDQTPVTAPATQPPPVVPSSILNIGGMLDGYAELVRSHYDSEDIRGDAEKEKGNWIDVTAARQAILDAFSTLETDKETIAGWYVMALKKIGPLESEVRRLRALHELTFRAGYQYAWGDLCEDEVANIQRENAAWKKHEVELRALAQGEATK